MIRRHRGVRLNWGRLAIVMGTLSALVATIAPPAAAAPAIPFSMTRAESPATASSSADDKIDDDLLKQLDRSPTEVTDFWVQFTGRSHLAEAHAKTSRAAQGAAVVSTLKNTASSAQSNALGVLKASKTKFTPFWITNAIRIEKGSADLARALAADPQVARIIAPVKYVSVEPVKQSPAAAIRPNADADTIEWGLKSIHADQVWNTYGLRGDGIVIANIDTGVQFDHPTLVDSYRGNNHDGTFSHDYNWFDTSTTPSPFPTDSIGHGTHTMGTMIGDDGRTNRIGGYSS